MNRSFKKIALFGGSFNPLHKGHEIIINNLVRDYEKILIIPSINPLKEEEFLSLEERIFLLNKVYKNNDKIDIFSLYYCKEFKYTYKLIHYMKQKYKDINLDLIIGGDYENIDNWKYSSYIKKNCNIIKFSRGNKKGDIDIKIPNISSTSIRDNIMKNKKFLNPIVYNYIINQKLIPEI